MNNEQYTNIMVAIAKVETAQMGTNDHLKTLNGKVATNVLSIGELKAADAHIKNQIANLTKIEEDRATNQTWWKQHFSAIFVTIILTLIAMTLKATGIINFNL